VKEMYQYPCGVIDDETETWKCEIACYMTGCKNCKNFNGTEYYVQNMKKGISMWAKHELSEMNKDD
jgi:hypothetical protein